MVAVIPEEDVLKLLTWDQLVPAIQSVMTEVSDGNAIQPARTIMRIPEKQGVLLTMPGMSSKTNTMACKLVTSFIKNPEEYSLPNIIANIMLFDANTGALQAVIAATAITEWRTAAATVVATLQLSSGFDDNVDISDRVVAILGAGTQGRIHMIAFHNQFKTKEFRLWNRNPKRSLLVARELKEKYNINVTCYETVEECVEGARIIVTATNADSPILKARYLTNHDVIINAIGAGINHHSELDLDLYSLSDIYIDGLSTAEVELKGLLNAGFTFQGEIGELINHKKVVRKGGVKLFHSLGMAAEDCVSARLIYDKYQNIQSTGK